LLDIDRSVLEQMDRRDDGADRRKTDAFPEERRPEESQAGRAKGEQRSGLIAAKLSNLESPRYFPGVEGERRSGDERGNLVMLNGALGARCRSMIFRSLAALTGSVEAPGLVLLRNYNLGHLFFLWLVRRPCFSFWTFRWTANSHLGATFYRLWPLDRHLGFFADNYLRKSFRNHLNGDRLRLRNEGNSYQQ